MKKVKILLHLMIQIQLTQAFCQEPPRPQEGKTFVRYKDLAEINQQRTQVEKKLNHLLGVALVETTPLNGRTNFSLEFNECELALTDNQKEFTPNSDRELTLFPFHPSVKMEMKDISSGPWGHGISLKFNLAQGRPFEIEIFQSKLELLTIKESILLMQNTCRQRFARLEELALEYVKNNEQGRTCDFGESIDPLELGPKESKLVHQIFKGLKYAHFKSDVDDLEFGSVYNLLLSTKTAQNLNAIFRTLEAFPEFALKQGAEKMKTLIDQTIAFEKSNPSPYSLKERASAVEAGLLVSVQTREERNSFLKKMADFERKYNPSSEDGEKVIASESEFRQFLGDVLRQLQKHPTLINALPLEKFVDFFSAVSSVTFHWEEMDILYNAFLTAHYKVVLDYLASEDGIENSLLSQTLKGFKGKLNFEELLKKLKVQNDFIWVLQELSTRSHGPTEEFGTRMNMAGFKMALLLRHAQRDLGEGVKGRWEKLFEESDSEEGEVGGNFGQEKGHPAKNSTLGFGPYKRWSMAGSIISSILKKEEQFLEGKMARESAVKLKSALGEVDLALGEILDPKTSHFDLLLAKTRVAKANALDPTPYDYLVMRGNVANRE